MAQIHGCRKVVLPSIEIIDVEVRVVNLGKHYGGLLTADRCPGGKVVGVVEAVGCLGISPTEVIDGHACGFPLQDIVATAQFVV